MASLAKLRTSNQNQGAADMRIGRQVRLMLGRLGVVGFGFFLIKGLLWLAIPWLIARGLTD